VGAGIPAALGFIHKLYIYSRIIVPQLLRMKYHCNYDAKQRLTARKLEADNGT